MQVVQAPRGDQSPFAQVLPFSPQSSVHAQPEAPQLQLEGWQVIGSGSGVHVKPAAQPVTVQLFGFGVPLHVVSSLMQLEPPVPQSAVQTQLSPSQVQLPEWHLFGSPSGTHT